VNDHVAKVTTPQHHHHCDPAVTAELKLENKAYLKTNINQFLCVVFTFINKSKLLEEKF